MIRTNLKIYSGKLDPIPIIDLFFLLLIFVLIGSSLVFHPGIQVQLPKAPATEMRGVPKIVVTITRPRNGLNDKTIDPPANGTAKRMDTPATELLFFNDLQVSWLDLEQKLRQAVQDRQLDMGRTVTEKEKKSGNRSNPLLVLRADAGVSYARIIQVMALGRTLGLGVYLVTDPGDTRIPPPGPAVP